MRLTKGKVPKSAINSKLIPYYNVYELNLERDGYFRSAGKDVKEYIRNSFIYDFSYDIYKLFTEDFDFIGYDKVYEKRTDDYVDFKIDDVETYVNEDIRRIEIMEKFIDSDLYKKICNEIEKPIDRCAKLFEIFNECNNSNPNSGEQGMSEKNPMMGGGSGERDNANADGQNIVNQLLATAIAETEIRENKKEIEQSTGDLTKKEKEILNGEKTYSVSGKDAGKEFSNHMRVVRDIIDKINFYKYFSLTRGSDFDIIGTFESERIFKKTEKRTVYSKIREIESISEEAKNILPYEHCFSDDVFYGKLVNKSTKVRRYYQNKKTKQVFYVLVDVSGSMSGEKDRYTKAIVNELMRRVTKGEAHYYLRPFAERPRELYKVKTIEEAENFNPNLIFNGGGTNIDDAIHKAIKDIKSDGFEKMDILLITDGQDGVYLEDSDLGNIKFNTFFVLSSDQEWSDSNFNERQERVEKMNSYGEIEKKKRKGDKLPDSGLSINTDLAKISNLFNVVYVEDELIKINRKNNNQTLFEADTILNY